VFITITFISLYKKRKKDMSKIRKPVPKRRPTQVSSNRLPLVLVLGGIVILVATLFFAFRKPDAQYVPKVTGGPSLKVDRTNVDLGDKKLGSNAEAAFVLTNVGDQVLQITQAPTIQVIEGC
jgi:hypothetical protein